MSKLIRQKRTNEEKAQKQEQNEQETAETNECQRRDTQKKLETGNGNGNGNGNGLREGSVGRKALMKQAAWPSPEGRTEQVKKHSPPTGLGLRKDPVFF